MKSCSNCKKEFEPKRTRAMFCSDLCRATFHQKKKLAKNNLDRLAENLKDTLLIDASEKAKKLYAELIELINNPTERKKSFEGFGEQQVLRQTATVNIPKENIGMPKPKIRYNFDFYKERIAEMMQDGSDADDFKKLYKEIKECDHFSDNQKNLLRILMNG
jgi:hypothetical protein